MGYLFENYMSDMPEEDVVKKLKMGINNTYNSFYREILDERELLEASDSRKLSYYDSQNFQLEEKFVINLFNEIGFNTDEISSKREYVDILGDGTLDGCFYHYHYLVEDLWNFIQGLNSYYFYG